MTVRSTKLVSGDSLDGVAVWLAWSFGVILPITISTLGNYVAFIGGWPVALAGDNMGIVNMVVNVQGDKAGFAVVWQFVATAAQWGFKYKASKGEGFNGWWIAYIGALLISVVPSFLAYNDPIATYMVPVATPYVGATFAVALTAMFTFLGTTLNDMVPEWIAVDSD